MGLKKSPFSHPGEIIFYFMIKCKINKSISESMHSRLELFTYHLSLHALQGPTHDSFQGEYQASAR